MSSAATESSTAAGVPADSQDEYASSVAYLQEQQANSPVTETLQKLPPYATRGLLYLFLLFLLTAALYSAVGKIDIIKEAAAVVVPEGHVKAIQTDCEGIVSRVAVHEGEAVSAGQILAIIDSREISSLLANLRAAEKALIEIRQELKDVVPLKRKQVESQQGVLRKRLDGLQQAHVNLERRIVDTQAAWELTLKTRDLEAEKDAEELQRLELEAKNVDGTFALWQRELETNQRLRERGVVSELQLLQVQRAHEEAAAAVSKSASLLREAKKSKEIAKQRFQGLELQHQQSLSDLREQLTQNKIAIEAALVELEQKDQELELLNIESDRRHKQALFQEEQAKEAISLTFRGVSRETLEQIVQGQSGVSGQTLLRAPIDGTVGKLFIRNSGEAVTRGQTVLTLIPAGVALHAEIRIPNKDVGRMYPGLPVRFKFDAFPHAEHGVILGELTKIVPEAEGDASVSSFYRAYSSLGQSYFRVEGRESPLLPGMTATAEIITERKTILSLLLKPFIELQSPQPAAQ